MEFSEDIQVLSLTLFDAAFPVPPEAEDQIKRRFMTLLAQTGTARRGGSAQIMRASNMLGETFAIKQLRTTANTADDAGNAQAPASTPAASATPRRQPTDETPAAAPRAGEAPKVLRASFDSRSSSTAGATPDYVTAGHTAAFYEEYRMHCLVANLQGFPKMYGFGLMGDVPIIVMEWVEGSTLRDALREMRAEGSEPAPLPLPVVADLGIAVLDILERAAALDEGLIHRDISPRNIMLRSRTTAPAEQLRTGDFDICLIDFGTAQVGAAPEDDDADFTRQAGIWRMGTPDYAPPEMLSADIDLPAGYRRSQTIDTYALSSVLYELYAGSKPYRLAPGDAASPYRVKTSQAPAPLVPRNPDGGALAGAIMTGLSAQQGDRPDVSQLKSALENWKRLPSAARIGALDGAKPADSTFWQPGYALQQKHLVTRRKFVAAGIVAAAAAVAAGIVVANPRTPARTSDPARYTAADGPYAGEPLFKALDGNLPGWTLCTAAGTIACKPASSRECGALREGLVALYDDISGLWGYIVPASTGDSDDYAWAILPAFAQAADFSEGLASAQDAETELWGYIDAAGSWTLAPRYAEAAAFSNGAAAVREARTDGQTGHWGAIDTAGKWAIEPAFSLLGALSAEGFATAQETPSSWGIVDATGAWASEKRFSQMRRFSAGVAPTRDDGTGLWGFTDETAAWAIEPAFRDARPFSNGLAAVQDEASQLWYFIGPDGSASGGMAPRFWKLGELFDGLAPAQASAEDDTVIFDENDPDARAEYAGMRYGYVDASGEWQMKRLTTLVDTAIGSPAI